ncbi:MAG: MOSC N-terminal beta barrel domain-containing protein [Bacteroidia bacterium]
MQSLRLRRKGFGIETSSEKMDRPFIQRIRIYPIKSLDPVEVQQAEVGIHSLKYDRSFALLGEDGRFINGKRTGLVNQLKASYDLENQFVFLSRRGEETVHKFELKPENSELVGYLEDFFGIKLVLLQNSNGKLMDIPTQSSVTVISTATLQSLQNDLKDHTLEDLRLRFRANIEIEGVEAFWEEKLFQVPGVGVRFTVGEVEMIGVSPRARCNVPPRNPMNGETDKSFIKKMMRSRLSSLPKDSTLLHYGNTYQLTVNTYLSPDQKGKIMKVGDPVEIKETVTFK